MAKNVGGNTLGNARVSRRFCAGVPDALVRNGLVFATVAITTGKQIGSRFLPAPILAKCFQQCRTEWQVAVMTALAAFHPNDHSLAIDICDLPPGNFGSAHTRSVENHQQGALLKVSSRINQLGDFF